MALVLSVTLISCIPCCFMNHEKENKRIHYSAKLTNKGSKTFFLFLSFWWYQTFNKKRITTRNLTHYKEFIIVFKSIAEDKKSFLYIKFFRKRCLYFPFLFPSSVLQSFFSFSASFPLWDSAPAHSPSGKELNPFS